MGASGWHYYVPYESDFGAALARLQQQVFASGDYYHRGKGRKPRSIKELLHRNAEEGTHSILDITRVGARPTKPGAEDFTPRPDLDEAARSRWVEDLISRIGSVRELHPDDLVELFGTTMPTRKQVEDRQDEIMEMRTRGSGTIVVIYEGKQPTELLFIGFSGD